MTPPASLQSAPHGTTVLTPSIRAFDEFKIKVPSWNGRELTLRSFDFDLTETTDVVNQELVKTLSANPVPKAGILAVENVKGKGLDHFLADNKPNVFYCARTEKLIVLRRCTEGKWARSVHDSASALAGNSKVRFFVQ